MSRFSSGTLVTCRDQLHTPMASGSTVMARSPREGKGRRTKNKAQGLAQHADDELERVVIVVLENDVIGRYGARAALFTLKRFGGRHGGWSLGQVGHKTSPCAGNSGADNHAARGEDSSLWYSTGS